MNETQSTQDDTPNLEVGSDDSEDDLPRSFVPSTSKKKSNNVIVSSEDEPDNGSVSPEISFDESPSRSFPNEEHGPSQTKGM